MSSSEEKPDKEERATVSAAKYISIATMLPAAVAVGYGVGYGLDYLFHTSYLRIVCLILGIVAGFYQLIAELTRDVKHK